MSENSSEYLKRTCLICGCHTNQTINIYEPRGGPNIVQLIQAKFKFQVNILNEFKSVYVYSIDFFKMSNISHRTVYRRLLIVRDFKLFLQYILDVCMWKWVTVVSFCCFYFFLCCQSRAGVIDFPLEKYHPNPTNHPPTYSTINHPPTEKQPQLSTRQHPCRLTLCRCCHDIRVLRAMGKRPNLEKGSRTSL